ncbi:MAG: hypothetical protein JXR37_20180 [Kiritimatiellae bacterium]|nr:hypothetical protein [Kiritimatiellia bacterium]
MAKRVLLVGAANDAHPGLRGALEQRGFEVVALQNARELSQALARSVKNGRKPAALVVGLLPDTEDKPLLTQTLEQQSTQIPVIVFSEFDPQQPPEHLSRIPGVGYVEKPFEPHNVASLVSQCLAAQDSQRQPGSPKARRRSWAIWA